MHRSFLQNFCIIFLYSSLNLTKEDFRTSLSPSGRSRPESLYVHGVNNMNTQQILNCFEEFQPIGN